MFVKVYLMVFHLSSAQKVTDFLASYFYFDQSQHSHYVSYDFRGLVCTLSLAVLLIKKVVAACDEM